MATTYVRDDISTISYQTSGDVPLPMIGSSTTVARGKAWIYGGRLATDHAHVGDLYELDLHTLKWTKVRQEQDDIPCPRYYHSMNYWNEYLVLFGGRGNGQTGTAQRSRVLNDVRFFDLGKRQWLPDSPSQQFQHLGDTEPVRDSSADGRCGHLSAVYGDHLFVCGGQTVDGTWIEDLCLYDLVSKQWLSCHPYRHRQSIYHSLAVSPTLKVAAYEAQLSALGSRENLFIHLPYSVPSSANSPGSVYICDFSSSPPRLEMFEADRQANIQVQNKRLSSATYLPPEIRFPSGGVLGNHLIVAGSISQTFSVWALNLRTLEWKQLDCGGALLSSNWHTAVPWSSQNKLVIFGRCSDLPANSRTQLACSWTHVAMMDGETYGIYQPPFRSLDVRAQRSGLGALASGIDANFTVACDDGRELRCSRKLLEERWPWFREQRTLLLQEAVNATDTIHGHPTIRSDGSQPAKQLDKRMSLRRLAFGQSYAVTLAFLQYFHTLALLTPLQHAPPVLSMLLVFSRDYHLPHLRELVKHAMHIALSKSTAQGVCEIARECKCYGLERRAQRLLATSKDGISPVSRAGPGGRLRALSASDAAARHPIPGPDTSRSELLQKQAQHHEQLPPLPVALDAADGNSPPIPSVPPLQPQDATSWVGRPRAVTSASVVRESVLSESSTLLSKSLPSKVSLDVASLGSSSISLSDRSVYSETSKSSFARILSPRKDKSTSKEAKEQMKLIQREEARWRKEHIISNYHTQPAKQVKVAFL